MLICSRSVELQTKQALNIIHLERRDSTSITTVLNFNLSFEILNVLINLMSNIHTIYYYMRIGSHHSTIFVTLAEPRSGNLSAPLMSPGLDHIFIQIGPAPSHASLSIRSSPCSLHTPAWELFSIGNHCNNVLSLKRRLAVQVERPCD